jgi:hypothetical protein
MRICLQYRNMMNYELIRIHLPIVPIIKKHVLAILSYPPRTGLREYQQENHVFPVDFPQRKSIIIETG